jgi:phosphoserine aminotransferase
MAIDYPNSPSLNDEFTVDTTTWKYNGTQWVIIVGEQTIATGSITTDKIATNAITAAKLATGATNDYVLMADSSAAAGVKWADIPPSGGLSTTTEGAIMTMTIGA